MTRRVSARARNGAPRSLLSTYCLNLPDLDLRWHVIYAGMVWQAWFGKEARVPGLKDLLRNGALGNGAFRNVSRRRFLAGASSLTLLPRLAFPATVKEYL